MIRGEEVLEILSSFAGFYIFHDCGAGSFFIRFNSLDNYTLYFDQNFVELIWFKSENILPAENHHFFSAELRNAISLEEVLDAKMSEDLQTSFCFNLKLLSSCDEKLPKKENCCSLLISNG